MKSKENIQTLIALLSQSSTGDYNELLKTFDFNSIDFSEFKSWSHEKYTRNCVYKDANFELILLCWEDGQQTSIHDHDGEDCWVYLLEGKLKEIHYTVDNNNYLREVCSQNYLPQDLSFMNDKIGFHRLKNIHAGQSVSLHLYAKPIENCVSFDENTLQFIERTLQYDTFKQLVLED
ncbi:cysteine dioxygenase [Psychroserpens sp. MEBiC05023]